jgi:uncharacterized protein YndB with AHSA1/START domain
MSNPTLRSRVGSAVLDVTAPTEIIVTRHFAATPDRVFEAYTDPALVRQWWCGPDEEWITCEVDLRVGGAWRWVFRHHAVDDGPAFEVGFHGEYLEVDGPGRLVWTEVFEGVPDPGPDGAVVNTMTLTRDGDLTLLRQVSVCPSAEVRDMILQSGMETGMQAGFDRIDALTAG